MSKYTGGVGRSISQLLLGPLASNYFWRFLSHIGTFVDHLGGVDTPAGRALAPKNQAKLSKYMGGRSILQLVLGLHAPNYFGGFLTHIGTFVDHLGGVDTPADRALAPKNQAKLSKYMGSGEVNISACIRAPCTKLFLGGS